jgi:putative effector of murein hydrolase
MLFTLAFTLTLVAHVVARVLQKKYPRFPLVVTALVLVLLFVWLLPLSFDDYYDSTERVFEHLLGYVTVALAIPLAFMSFEGIPYRKLTRLLLLSTLVGVLLPVGLAALIGLGADAQLAFVTRAVTTPIALNIAEIINAPLALASLIIVISGLLGAAAVPWLLKDVTDDRAKGLAMGLVAHAIGTAEAWQISPLCGRYSAFGMAINGLLTALWAPWVFAYFY